MCSTPIHLSYTVILEPDRKSWRRRLWIGKSVVGFLRFVQLTMVQKLCWGNEILGWNQFFYTHISRVSDPIFLDVSLHFSLVLKWGGRVYEQSFHLVRNSTLNTVPVYVIIFNSLERSLWNIVFLASLYPCDFQPFYWNSALIMLISSSALTSEKSCLLLFNKTTQLFPKAPLCVKIPKLALKLRRVRIFPFFQLQGYLIESCITRRGFVSFRSDGTSLKLVDKFTYLGSSVSSTEKDIDTRLTKAWAAIDRLSIIWKSDLTDKMKRSFFQAAVVSILLYGYTTWTLTKRLKKQDGNYTGMLRAILNKSWRQHPIRHQLRGHLPPITKTIQVRRTRHAGHMQGRAHKWCIPMDPYICPGKSRTASSNLHTAAMWGYGM